jgi:hypothetical protein
MALALVVIGVISAWFGLIIFPPVSTDFLAQWYALLVTLATLTGVFISAFLFKMNDTFSIYKDYRFFIINLVSITLDFIVLLVLVFVTEYPWNYIAAFIVQIILAVVEYYAVWWIYNNYYKITITGDYTKLTDVDRQRYDREHHGWLSVEEIIHYYRMWFFELAVIYITFLIGSAFWFTRLQAVYIGLIALIPLLIINIVYWYWDPLRKNMVGNGNIVILIERFKNPGSL